MCALLLTPAKQLGVPFIETSAKTGHNVQEAFLILTRLLQEAAASITTSSESIIRLRMLAAVA